MNRWRYLSLGLVAALGMLILAKGVVAAPTCVDFSGTVGSTCTLTAQAIDPEGDQIYYIYSWGDGTPDTRVPASGFVPSGTQVSADHTWNTAGVWTIRVYAYDEAGHVQVDGGGNPVGSTTVVNITALVLSASLSGTPNTAGWYNYTTFDYTTSCTADSGQTLRYCRTQVSINSGGWNNVPGGNPNTSGQATYTYNGSYTFPTNGASYRFRSRADDTGSSPVVTSAIVPPSGQIQIDQSVPLAAASSPGGNQAAPFVVSATLVDYPNPGVGPNSGVSTWDLQYRAGSGGTWTNCLVNIAAGQSSVSFGGGCSPTVTLVPNTTYCFRARARDSTNPTQNQSNYTSATDGDSCTPYMVSSPPFVPSNPSPADGSLVSDVGLQLQWDGGDPDGAEEITYSIYLSQSDSTPYNPASPSENLNGQRTAFGNQTRVTYTPTGTFTDGSQYYWQVVAQDAVNTISGPVWNFIVNTPPLVTNVSVTPNPVNTVATITWDANDANSSQSLQFYLYYGPSIGSQAVVIDNSGLTPAEANCSGSPNSYTGCTYSWASSCTPEAAGQYITVVASDGLDSGSGSSAAFSINHTETKYYPGPGDTNYDTASDSEIKNFTIDEGSIASGSSYIKFIGSCSDIEADANAPGNEAVCGGSSGYACSGEDIPLSDLIKGSSNAVAFGLQGCASTQYRIRYDLVAACDQPYLSVEQGSIYSQGDIRAQYAPPSGSYNATYFILGGGTAGNPRVIENFISQPPPAGLSFVNPSFGQLIYPGTTSDLSPQISSFDYYGLTHNLGGSEVADNGSNSYGHQVQVFSNAGGDVSLSQVVSSSALAHKVYWVKDNLVVDSATEFANGTGTTSGAGLIIVDGNLTINSTLSYQPAIGLSARNLASVGWLVMGNVTIAPTVNQVVGAFFVAGVTGGGTFATGAGASGLTIYGAVIAKQFQLQRTTSAGGQASERVVADGRVLLNTPPGFKDIISTLPTWQFRTP